MNHASPARHGPRRRRRAGARRLLEGAGHRRAGRRPRPRRRPPPSRTPAVADAADGIAWKKASSDADIEAAFAHRPRRDQAGVPLLGREVVPAVQPGPGDALQPPGLHRALARLRAGVRRRRQPRRAEARHALSGQRLSDDGAAQAERRGGDPPARRGRPGPLHRAAQPRHERGPAGQGGAGRRARRRQGAEGRTTGACSPSIPGTPTRPRCSARTRSPRPWPSSPPPARPTSPRRRCAFASRRWPRATPRRRPRPTSRPRPAVLAAARRRRRRRATSPTCSSTSPPTSSAPSPRRARRERAETLATFDTALQRLEADTTLSRADRMQALIARIDLVRIDLPKDAKPAAARPSCRSRCSSTCARRRPAPTARSPTATSARP